MPAKRRRSAAGCSNLIKARLSNPKNRGVATVKHPVCVPPKKRRQTIQNPKNLPRYCRVRIVCKGVSRIVVSPGIRKQLLTRKRRKAKPSSVPGNLAEQAAAPRGLCGGYRRDMRGLHGMNLHRVRATNKRHNFLRDAKSAAATRARRAQQQRIITEAHNKLQKVLSGFTDL